ncbi:hypothetical protein RclHR1_01790019 [Rhizophagus clarus]|uniref:Uncharacterized protein n=1 Tax=Rhizophagus clarus TaxID=94130 RepID=A0A2Z6QQ60_9GLOM|nr:hypothetical protein RclHR1_01790019 [Rhizophagus clarus]
MKQQRHLQCITELEAENSKVGELEARLAILEQSPPIVDGQLQNDKKVTSEASVVVVSDSSSFHEVYSQLKLSRSKMYQSNDFRKRNKEKKLSNAGQDQVSLQKISDTASGISSSEKLVNTKNGQGLIQEILTTLMNPPLLHSTGALSPNPPEISLISVNIICLYQRASNAEGLAMKANQEEILSWYLCAKEFLIMVKDIMASDRVGIDKVRYIKTCSANSISKITNTDLQKVIDHFSNNSNSSTEAEISSTSCHPNHVTKIFETVCSKKVSPEVNVSTTPKPAEVTSSNRSRLPISILPEDPEEKRKHIIGLVLERFPNLYLIDSSEHCEWFNFNNSTLCLLRKDHKEESLWNNIKGEWGPGNYYGEQTYRILCKDPLNPGTPIVSGLRHIFFDDNYLRVMGYGEVYANRLISKGELANDEMTCVISEEDPRIANLFIKIHLNEKKILDVTSVAYTAYFHFHVNNGSDWQNLNFSTI